jgi:hypothetical protein
MMKIVDVMILSRIMLWRQQKECYRETALAFEIYYYYLVYSRALIRSFGNRRIRYEPALSAFRLDVRFHDMDFGVQNDDVSDVHLSLFGWPVMRYRVGDSC